MSDPLNREKDFIFWGGAYFREKTENVIPDNTSFVSLLENKLCGEISNLLEIFSIKHKGETEKIESFNNNSGRNGL